MSNIFNSVKVTELQSVWAIAANSSYHFFLFVISFHLMFVIGFGS